MLTLEELGARRGKLEERLTLLEREAQQAAAQVLRDAQVQEVATNLERFRARIAQCLDQADFAM